VASLPRFERRPAPSPSFNYGWRLGVVIGASVLVLCTLASVLGLVKEVCDVYF
jgi:hypothetical protein